MIIESVNINGKKITMLNLDSVDANGEPDYKRLGLTDEQANELLISEKWRVLKSKRDQLLAITDFTQISDSPLTTEQKAAYAAYRQALRDIPQTYSDPDAVVWPEKPTV